MPAPVYSKLLAAVDLPYDTIHSVPVSANTLVVRDIEVYGYIVPTEVRVSLRGLAFAVKLVALGGDQPDWVQWKGRIVVPAGTVLDVYCAKNHAHVVISGYELPG
jgi:hypothetical protein